jgi:hypothetical protein
METIRKRNYKPWIIALVVILMLIVLAALILPIFSTAREHARQTYPHSESRMSDQILLQESSSPSAVAYKPKSMSQGGSGGVMANTAWASNIPRMVISKADVSMEVKSVQKTHDKIVRIAADAGGFITTSTLTNYEGQRGGEITVRVPSKQYESVLRQIGRLGKVLSKQQSGEDVTEEYVDLQSRIRNWKREEAAFLDVLTKARRVPDILAVENELSRVRQEIEQAQGRVQFLQSQVALATINVSLEEPSPVVTKIVAWNIGQTAKGATNALLVVLRVIASFIIWAIVWIPLWAILGLVAYGIKRYSRRGR